MRTLGMWFTSLGLAALTSACGSAPIEPAIPDADLVLVADETRSPLLGYSALEMLPHDTELVVVARDLQSLAKALQYDGLRSKYAALIEPASADVTKELGENLMVAEGFRRIGIDISQPWGFALLDSRDEAGCIFAKVGDPDAFKSWFYRLGALHHFDVKAETAGEALILRSDDEPDGVWVLTGGYVFLVLGDRTPDSVLEHARSIQTGGRSLAGDAQFKRLREREIPGDAAAYIATPMLIQGFGVPRMGVRAVPVVGDIDGAVLSVTLGPRHIALQGFIGVDSERLLARAMRVGGLPRVLTVNVGPSLAGSAHLEPEELAAAFDAVVSLDEEPAKVRKEILRETGVDLDRELLPALSGDVGFIHRRQKPDGPDDYPRSRITFTLGLSDVARGKQIASKMAGRMGRDPQIRVIGDQLVVSDDAEAIRQLSSDTSLFTPEGLTMPDGLFTSTAMTLRIDAEVVARELFGFGYDGGWDATAKAAAVLAVDSSPDTPEALAIRRRMQELEKNRDALQAKLDRAYDRERRAERDGAQKIAHALGSGVISFRPIQGGFEVLGGQFLREKDGAALLDRIVGEVVATEKRKDAMERESETLYEQLRTIDEQLQREREALRNAEQGGGVAKPIR